MLLWCEPNVFILSKHSVHVISLVRAREFNINHYISYSSNNIENLVARYPYKSQRSGRGQISIFHISCTITIRHLKGLKGIHNLTFSNYSLNLANLLAVSHVQCTAGAN